MPSVSVPVLAASATAAGSLGAAAIQGNAAQSAANTQANAAKSAQQTELQMFDQTQQNLQPWMTTGSSALSQLASLFGVGTGGAGGSSAPGGISSSALSSLENTPGYQFQMTQGLQALDRTAASRGLDLSGAQLKDAQTYGQGLAQSSAWQPYVSALTGLSNSGLSAANSLGGFSGNTANNVSQLQLAQGQANAAGIVGSSNALTSGLQGALGNSLLSYTLANNAGSGVSGAAFQPANTPLPSGFGVISNPLG